VSDPQRAASFDPRARTVVVIAGAAARGPYEAAVLAQALPALFGNDLSNVVLLGTSAGAINAALWAAGLSANALSSDVGEQVKTVWHGITQRRVFVTSSAAMALARLAVRGLTAFFVDCGCDLLATNGLLNTDPLQATAQAAFDAAALKRNVDEGRLLGVGAVATSCPNDGSGGRSRVFLYGRPELYAAPGLSMPPAGSSIDYALLSNGLKLEHVLASAAIPVAFAPIQVSEPANYAGWYTDGGVRLNTPIRPALDMETSQLVVISSLATCYPEQVKLANTQPNIFDVGAQSIHTVLGDGTIEDLRSLSRINSLVAQAANAKLELTSGSGRAYRMVKYLAIAPDNGTLSQLADEELQNARKARLTYRALSAVLRSAGAGDAHNELASYLLFYPHYAERLFDRAESDVAAKGPLADAFVV
jgi:NTE family protein